MMCMEPHEPSLRQNLGVVLRLRKPDFELNIDTSGYGKEVADVILKSEEVMIRTKPDALLVLGDTYSGLAVLPASHRGIKIFHMEAGLRAWDRRMQVLTTAPSLPLFPPGLRATGISARTA